MSDSFQTILSTHGKEVQIHTAQEQKTVHAFVQMIRKKETHAPEEETNFGAEDLRRWLYIGPPNQPVKVGDRLSADGQFYTVQTAEAICVGTKRTHWWALLRPERERLV